MSVSEPIREGYDLSQILIGESPPMVELRQAIEKFGLRKPSVLLFGESGTGKELVARALHRLSKRSQGPLISVNCAALPHDLAESELFGHERGSFTGAFAQHRGFFEQANHGTLFLDEIGEINVLLQAKLLRAIQYSEFRRVGGKETIHVDIRVIAATNRDLKAAIAAKAFREDLYFRVKQLFIKVPALRERRGDIALLARHFVSKYAAENELLAPKITPGAFTVLQQYDWPGNVRELENVVGQAVEHSSDGLIRVRDLPEELFPPGQGPNNVSMLTMAQFLWKQKREYAEYIYVQVAERDYELAAALLDIHPSGFHAYMRRLELDHLFPGWTVYPRSYEERTPDRPEEGIEPGNV